MVRALPEDGNRYEVVYGELLVTPAPRLWHQQLVGRLHVFVVPVEQARTLDWTGIRDLLLVAEVLSPFDSAPRPLHQAPALPRGRRAAVLDRGWRRPAGGGLDAGGLVPQIERERLIWQPEGIETPFTLWIPELSRPIE